MWQAHRLPRHASFNGSGLMATYLVVFAMLACPMSFWSLQASILPLACAVPEVCRKQCGWTGKSRCALRPAVAIILLMAKRLKLLAAFAGEAAPGLLLALEPFQGRPQA